MVDADVSLDEAGESGHVLVDTSEGLHGSFADGPRKTSAHGVDEDEIGLVQQRVLVRHDLIRAGARCVRARCYDANGSDGSHVEPEGGAAGATVESECDGPRFRIGAVLHIGDIEHSAFDVSLITS